jgi:hypothetical protein
MKSSASATAGTRSAGRHAGPRHPQDWKGAGRPVAGRHAQDRRAPDHYTPAALTGALARRFAVSAGC